MPINALSMIEAISDFIEILVKNLTHINYCAISVKISLS